MCWVGVPCPKHRFIVQGVERERERERESEGVMCDSLLVCSPCVGLGCHVLNTDSLFKGWRERERERRRKCVKEVSVDISNVGLNANTV